MTTTQPALVPHEACPDCTARFELLTFSKAGFAVGWKCPVCGGSVHFSKEADLPPTRGQLVAGVLSVGVVCGALVWAVWLASR